MDNCLGIKTAVLIDYENANLTDSYPLLFNKLIKEGYNPCLRKIVSSTLPKKSDFIDIIKDNRLDVVISYKHIKKGTSKIVKEKNLNNADFRMYIEALRILYTRDDINTFVIFAADDDYSELICTIKSEGKFVIGVGSKLTTAQNYQNLYDKFYYTEDLMNEFKVAPVKHVDKVEKETISKSVKPEIKDHSKEKKNSAPAEKNEIFYSILKVAIGDELNDASLKGNDKPYYIANIVSKIKDEQPYFKNFSRITANDIKKCGYDIKYDNGEKVKGYLLPTRR